MEISVKYPKRRVVDKGQKQIKLKISHFQVEQRTECQQCVQFLIQQIINYSQNIINMKRQHPLNDDASDNDVSQSCPTILQQDITKSINSQDHRSVKSQSSLPNYYSQITLPKQPEKKQIKNQVLRNSNLSEKPKSENKIEVNYIYKKGTDFDCQKVESLQLSYQEQSYRSESLKSRKNRLPQELIQQPISAKKYKKYRSQQIKRLDPQRRDDIKQDILNVFLAGAEDTGKTTFRCCFKRKQRKFDQPHIKPRTKQIKYELGMADQNLLNKRNTVYFIDLAGFAPNQEDKYLREIQQQAIARWRNFQAKPDQDRRIHCCLYFLRGPRIKDSDINVMKKLSSLFNLIPVIAKSDHYTKEEILEIKEQFHRKVAAAGQVYLYDLEQFYLFKLGTDRISEALHSKFGKFPPFVIASSFEKQSPESSNFVRKYSWGQLEIQNQEHTDFEKLCELLSGDVRRQLLNKLVPPVQREQPEIIYESMNLIGNDIENQQHHQKSFWQKIKNKLVLGSLVVLCAGLLFCEKGKQCTNKISQA